MTAEFDRDLIEVITDVDGSEVWELRELVELRGAALVSRVITDGFAGVFPGSENGLFRGEPEYLPRDHALQAVGLEQIPGDYGIGQMPGALDVQYDATPIFRYAADEPGAIAEVRSRHRQD